MYLSFRSSLCGGDSLMEILDTTCHRRYQWRHCRHRWRHRHRLQATEDQFENPVAEGLTPIPVQSRKKINSKETFFYYVENRNPRLIKKLLCVRLLNRSDFQWCSKSGQCVLIFNISGKLFSDRYSNSIWILPENVWKHPKTRQNVMFWIVQPIIWL